MNEPKQDPTFDPDSCQWTFRGRQLESGSFATAMIHLYRGEVSRSNTWRTRLDATTNWAVVSVGAVLTFVFSAPQNPHYVLLLALLLVLTFLHIEGRRYRYYALWSYRVHWMETDFFAPMLVPPFGPSPDWADHLAESLLDPKFPISTWEAIGRRFQRNYVWLISLLLASWAIKLALHPLPAPDAAALIERAAIGGLSGVWVATAVLLVYSLLAVLGIAAHVPRDWKSSLLRLRERFAGPVRRKPSLQEQLAIIITDQGPDVAARLMAELGRGVTAVEGTGMYTGAVHHVLLCAASRVQLAHLKTIVHQVDPQAFVVVGLVEEVLGRGFKEVPIPS